MLLPTPVVMMVFNRPHQTRLLFERIRLTRPRALMVIADGPRASRPKEIDNCEEVRRIVEKVDWPCDLLRNYSASNMGCGARVSSGLDWVFRNFEEAIVLEDDCLPDPSFFRFCNEMLDRYRGDERVMQISGSNFLFGRRFVETDYYFSRYPIPCWGWATWRRAWQRFDIDMGSWRQSRSHYLQNFNQRSEKSFWQTIWDDVSSGKVDNWDPQWAFACLSRGGLSVVPTVNLISNIGFGSVATHTRSRLAALRPAVRQMRFPLRHPNSIVSNIRADAYTARLLFYQRTLPGKGIGAIRRTLLGALSHLRSVLPVESAKS